MDDRTLVPVRFIAESFGAKVGWDGNTQTVTVESAGKTITLVIDSKKMTVGSETVELDVPAQTINDRTLIPLRAIVEALGKQVFWDERGLIVMSEEKDICLLYTSAIASAAVLAAFKASRDCCGYCP